MKYTLGATKIQGGNSSSSIFVFVTMCMLLQFADSNCLCMLLNYLLIYLLEKCIHTREREERERISHLLAQTLDPCHDWGCAKARLRILISTQVSHMSGGNLSIWSTRWRVLSKQLECRVLLELNPGSLIWDADFPTDVITARPNPNPWSFFKLNENSFTSM